MASLVDVDNSGDAKRAVEQLTEEAKEQRAGVITAEAKPEPQADEAEEARFKGKSREEILTMYHNLESHQGRLASELGQTRRTVDEILLQKRREDLSSNGADDMTIDPSDMLTKPKEVLDRYVDAKAKAITEPLTQRLNNLEQTLLNNAFQSRHADSGAVAATAQFKNWVRETPLRQQLANNAAGGNVQAADALMTEYKAATPAVRKNLEAALDSASRTTLEGSRVSGDSSSSGAAGKKYKRGDLMRLRQQDPDKYDALGAEIYKAYQEGRVVA